MTGYKCFSNVGVINFNKSLLHSSIAIINATDVNMWLTKEQEKYSRGSESPVQREIDKRYRVIEDFNVYYFNLMQCFLEWLKAIEKIEKLISR